MISKKTIYIILILTVIIIGILTSKVLAKETTNYIVLSDEKITLNGETIRTDTNQNIYLSTSTNNGGTSSDAKSANIEIKNVLNINSSGTYEFTGKLSDGQISVNSNNINGEVIIVLNNVEITCENAPAIIVYNKETKSDTCTVTIKTAEGSINTVTGSRIKQSVEGWTDQESIIYYIEKGTDDDGSYYERYKYDGAISSDISLNFEGEGSLTINVTGKEGIETKRNITINSGEYIINSLDDGINACADNESIITINGGSVLVNLLDEAEEGDGIDSNGSLYINGGKIFAFASEISGDSGLDSDNGIYINGGYVVGIGNMSDAVSSQSKQAYMQLQLGSKVEEGTLLTILDENENPLVAFESDRSYTVLTISTPDLKTENIKVYEGGSIQGTNENGLYAQISSYSKGTEKEYTNVAERGMMNNQFKDMFNQNNGINIDFNIYYYTLLGLGVLLAILIGLAIVLNKKGKIEMKGKVLTLIIGILIGAIIATAGFMVYSKITVNNMEQNMGRDKITQMQNKGDRFNGQRPEMPEGMIPPDNQGMPNKGGTDSNI